jgi:hypothetical protein
MARRGKAGKLTRNRSISPGIDARPLTLSEICPEYEHALELISQLQERARAWKSYCAPAGEDIISTG